MAGWDACKGQGGTRAVPLDTVKPEIADFEPSTGHRHACPWNRLPQRTQQVSGIAPCDCAAWLYSLMSEERDAKILAPGALTVDEHEALRLSGQLSILIRRICGTGRIADEDFNELAAPIHVLQRTIGSQAAARAYPYRYRLLGAKVLERTDNKDLAPLPSVGP